MMDGAIAIRFTNEVDCGQIGINVPNPCPSTHVLIHRVTWFVQRRLELLRKSGFYQLQRPVKAIEITGIFPGWSSILHTMEDQRI
ncbi:hypothetical protein OSTOST_12848 [Ostertagia ostertagi]